MIFQGKDSGVTMNQELDSFQLLEVCLFLFMLKMGETLLDSSRRRIKPCTDSLGYIEGNHSDYI